MDALISVMMSIWNFFTSVNLPITYQGVTYNITLLAIFLFTTIGSIALWLLFRLFD